MAGRKVFIGGCPDGVQEDVLRSEFSKHGEIEDVFVKQGCESGRQWAMITFASQSEAQQAKEATDRILQLPGHDRPLEVMIARNQGKSDSGRGDGGGAKKIFVGSLPDSITENALREEFSKYGPISDIYLKTGCERNKQWAFLTFNSAQDAEVAKTSTDRQLKFPDSEVTCEVMMARNQGMNGRDPLRPAAAPAPSLNEGPTKIFVGSLPDDISEMVLRAEFSKYGHITDVYLKTGCETNKQWAFIVFATNSQAQNAKDATDRRLQLPGSSTPCEVMFAKYQGKHGQDPLTSVSGGSRSHSSHSMVPAGPPMGAPPPQYAWRVYQTPQGIAYYHNHVTGVTQWECPPEFHYSQMAMQQQQASMYGAMYGMPPGPSPMYRPY